MMEYLLALSDLSLVLHLLVSAGAVTAGVEALDYRFGGHDA